MTLEELLEVVPDNYPLGLMDVVAIHPGVRPYLPDATEMYGDDSVELHVRTGLLIEVSPE